MYISVSSPSSNGVPDKPACFECADGRCINPVLPVYDEDFERPLSFLCDGYNHCADGTDERKGIIYGKQLPNTSCLQKSHINSHLITLYFILSISSSQICVIEQRVKFLTS